MRVKFTRMYCAPSVEIKLKDGRTIKGVRYREGIYDDVPDDLPLPKSAIVLNDVPDRVVGRPAPALSGPNPIQQFDLDRAAGENEDVRLAQAAQQAAQPVKRGPGRPRKYDDLK